MLAYIPNFLVNSTAQTDLFKGILCQIISIILGDSFDSSLRLNQSKFCHFVKLHNVGVIPSRC